MNSPNGTRVVVGMSGGVDSSVSAALLKEQGYDVIGMMLRLWSDSNSQNLCCAPDAQAEARYIAGLLEFPFYVIDAQDQFYQAVVLPFVDGYAQGITPNPCLNCNRFIRWDFLLERAAALGAKYLATGHYARIQQTPTEHFQLLKSRDLQKDQSYVLHVLTQKSLSQTIFPLANLSKPQVRKLAREYSLPVAERPDSQDLCFVGQGDYRDFLRKTDPSINKPGPILNPKSKIIGEHPGLADFTIGQRKGLRISSPESLYVIRKDIDQNALIVGNREHLGRTEFFADQVNWIAGVPPQDPIQATIKIRYKSPETPGTITALKGHSVQIQLESPLPDITPGQAAVFYQNDICLGGGIIRSD